MSTIKYAEPLKSRRYGLKCINSNSKNQQSEEVKTAKNTFEAIEPSTPLYDNDIMRKLFSVDYEIDGKFYCLMIHIGLKKKYKDKFLDIKVPF